MMGVIASNAMIHHRIPILVHMTVLLITLRVGGR